ncbi:23S rRNA pseudouridine(1911/1915/1917) synthase [Alkalilimnicola ehrlichii]|uniref:Pseudouridine synthase n=1 Tax=Alkalilimnicola ehrlichii TaxID=351052 RepID=A0A3E0X193_9GAMM|nr:23S rRNA pseudouridine(1911/1915/1917) synthase RluD [Alkalilimnicola ehrlichii]RFA31308.1 23S rRNA pseudouridine(1911/1915/1917) synthase [Alkalilimnicola ehrlichii]RFA39419.1 23S rRNA pseudouridine(1911/1915/1917) synthase [Alkalilimnicola ehrlichii]
MSDTVQLSAIVPADCAGQRLDQVLAQLFPDFSRSRLQAWIKAGEVEVDGRTLRPRDKVYGGETVVVAGELETNDAVKAQPLALDLVYEDEAILVLHKPAGLIVHPGAGNPDGTVQNALLHHAPELAVVPRAGIVHRLDKDTSGLMVVAKTLAAHKSLVEQLSARTVRRDYLALINGTLTAGGRVEGAIGRHPRDRKRMAVLSHGGRPAITHYRLVERFRAHTLVRASLETGRTHQIRVHMAYIGHSLVGDPVYGGRLLLPKGASELLRETLRGFRRQALHATRLGLVHPETGEPMEWEVQPPRDLQDLLAVMRSECPADTVEP